MGFMVSPEVLRRISLFATLTEPILQELAIQGEEVEFGAGDWIFREGDPADALFIILNGRVDLKLVTDASRTTMVEISTLVDGEIAGWSVLVDPYVYRMGAVAAVPTRVVRLPGDKILSMIETHPEAGCWMMRHMLSVVAQRLDMLHGQFVSLINTQ